MGRNRKSTARRKPSGDPVSQLEAPALLARRRRAMAMIWQDSTNPLHGYHLGILRASKQISDAAFQAGERYAKVRTAYALLKGFPSPFPPCMDPNKVRGALNAMDNEEAIEAAERSNDRMTMAVGLCGHWKAELLLRKLCIMNEAPEQPNLTIQVLEELAVQLDKASKR